MVSNGEAAGGRRVFVVEPSNSGHRLYYVRVLALSRPEQFVWITTRGAASSPEAEVHLADLIEAGRIVPRVLDDWRSRRKIIGAVTRLVERDGRADDVVVVLDGDLWLPTLIVSLWRRGHVARWSILLLRPPERWRAATWRTAIADFPKVVAIRLLQLVSRASGIDVKLAGLADAFGYAPSETCGLISVRDPILPRDTWTREEARATLGLPNDAFVVSLLGPISRRKNLPLTAKAVSALPPALNPVLLVCGRLAPDLREELAGLVPDGRLVTHDRYVPEDEL